MIRKSQSTISDKLPAIITLAALIIIWQVVCTLGIVPSYMLPSPIEVVSAFINDFSSLMENAKVTLTEAVVGLGLGILIGFIFAVSMDASTILYKAIYPILVLSQTIPTVAIAPLLVLWFGYEMTPKIILIVLVSFFPMAVGLLDGFKTVDNDEVNLLRSMGANRYQIFRYIKFPAALPQFFSALRISVTYAVVGAVISEWLGGFSGLGVYMTRVKKAYAFDQMFAVIFLISGISLVLIVFVNWLAKKCMPYLDKENLE